MTNHPGQSLRVGIRSAPTRSREHGSPRAIQLRDPGSADRRGDASWRPAGGGGRLDTASRVRGRLGRRGARGRHFESGKERRGLRTGGGGRPTGSRGLGRPSSLTLPCGRRGPLGQTRDGAHRAPPWRIAAAFIENGVRALRPEGALPLIEERDDLRCIRVNGTVVGGLAGGMIHAVHLLLGLF